MNIKDFKDEYDKLTTKCNLKGMDGLEAVKEDGDALRYVNSKFFE